MEATDYVTLDLVRIEFLGVSLRETREDSCQPNVKRGQNLRPTLALRPEGFVEPWERERFAFVSSFASRTRVRSGSSL